MPVIEFFELWPFETFIYNSKEFSVKSQFTVCHSSFPQTNGGSLFGQRCKSATSNKFLWSSVSRWICYRLCCARWFLSLSALYGGRFKCLGGTPIHPRVQHSPMASSPFPVPRKKDVIVNLDPALIHIHSPPGSRAHAWTINSGAAINFAQSEEKMNHPGSGKREMGKNMRIKGFSYESQSEKHVF